MLKLKIKNNDNIVALLSFIQGRKSVAPSEDSLERVCKTSMLLQTANNIPKFVFDDVDFDARF